jgi:hypothetical protein
MSFFTLFLGILTAPHTTFDRILQGPRYRYVWSMVFLAGFFICLADGARRGEIWRVLLFPLVGVALYLGLWIIAWLFSATEKLLGGTADLPELYDYLIWTLAPVMVGQIAGIIRYILPWRFWHFGWGVVEAALSIWALLLSLMFLAVVQKYSLWKALLNAILVAVIFGLPFALFWVLISLSNV